MRLPFNVLTLFKYRKLYLAAVLIFFTVFALLFTKINFREDITEMLPSSLSGEMRLFQNSPLSSKVFIMIKASSFEKAKEAAEIIADSLTGDTSLGLSLPQINENFFMPYYYSLPRFCGEDMLFEIDNITEKSVLKKTMQSKYETLLSPSPLSAKLFVCDPIGLSAILPDLSVLNITNAELTQKSGYLSDGKNILLVLNSDRNQFDASCAKKIKKIFDSAKQKLPDDTSSFMVGAVRYTNENNEIIMRDVKKILLISSSLMLILFFVFFRDKKALAIYLVPPAVMFFAGVTASFFFKGISGIVAGFGSVLIGLSIDYSVYMYFALKASLQEARFQTAKKMISPIFAGAATSVTAFFLLYFSSIAVFKQISIFAVSGLVAAFFLAVCVAPFVFVCENKKETTFGKIKPFFSGKIGVIIIVLFFIGGLLSLKYIRFDVSLDSLNTVSKVFEKEKKEFDEFTANAYGGKAFFFVFGKTEEEALKNNEIISSSNKDTLKLARLYPSKETQERNISFWKKFWNEEKIAALKAEIDGFYKPKGIKTQLFDDFYDFLKTGKNKEEEKFSLEDIYNPVIKHNDGFAFVNIVPENAVILQKEGIETLFVSNGELRKKISSRTSSEIIKIMCFLILCSFFVLIFVLKKVQFAIAALLPTLCGICAFLIAAAFFAVEVNLFGLFAAPLLIGLGIDYAIFVIYQQKGDGQLHPAKAVIVAALSTMIGFGSLIFAEHKVLFMIGFMVFTGILTAIAVSVFILPSLLKRADKKIILPLLFFIVLPLSGCLSSGVKYNVAEPEFVEENTKTAMFYGSYKDDLQFRAISRSEEDGYRIVIMNDFGVKIQDMKIKKESDTDIYFYVDYIPKEIVEDFAGFFREYYFEENKKNIALRQAEVYYFRRGQPILWMREI